MTAELKPYYLAESEYRSMRDAVDQVQRLGPLVEAARAYRAEFMATGFATNAAVVAVLAAAAALDEEGGE